MNEKTISCLVYLDHNVLDKMTKGNLSGVRQMFNDPKFTCVFSDENLNEIRRSKGFENTFLQLLKDVKAKHLKPTLVANFQQTEKAELRDIDPFEAYASYIENVESMPKFGYGLSGMLQKFYGGLDNTSFQEISNKGADELETLLLSSIKELESSEELGQETLCKIKQDAEQLIHALRAISEPLAIKLDSQNDKSQVCQFEDATGVGPIILNNIKGPNVVLKVWEKVKEGLSKTEEQKSDLDLETFFGLKKSPWSNLPNGVPTLPEKVNTICHQLNLFGYYSDSKMKVERRFNASFSDVMHAGVAAFCHFFICQDKNLVMKATAAYEYLGINTTIIFLDVNGNASVLNTVS